MELLYEWRGHYDHGGHGKCDRSVPENGRQLRLFNYRMEHAQYLDRWFHSDRPNLEFRQSDQQQCDLCRVQHGNGHGIGRVGRFNGSSG